MVPLSCVKHHENAKLRRFCLIDICEKRNMFGYSNFNHQIMRKLGKDNQILWYAESKSLGCSYGRFFIISWDTFAFQQRRFVLVGVVHFDGQNVQQGSNYTSQKLANDRNPKPMVSRTKIKIKSIFQELLFSSIPLF